MKIVIIYMTLVQNFETNWYQFDITVIYLEYQNLKKKALCTYQTTKFSIISNLYYDTQKLMTLRVFLVFDIL